MANYLVDQRDVEFVIYEQLKIEELCQRPLYQTYSREVVDMILKEIEKLAVNELAANNASGDREGCKLVDGKVTVPEAFHRNWKLFKDGGWLTLNDSSDVGGQGAPFLIGAPCHEYEMAANYSFYTYTHLTRGAARLIQNFGTAEQKRRYMYKMFSGEWAGTMCLTEPDSGTDVGSIRTKATRNADGTYSITGTKIFITDGDHNLTDNIVHPVLARIEGAPVGTRGISLFLVPKYRVEANGDLGSPNDVKAAGIEHKLGIHGSSTCLLKFGEDGKCIGELLGGENQGMQIMFHMMNEARIGVGLQGLALASSAYLYALQYAKERIQGVEAGAPKDRKDKPVPIIRHPDVRRMLMNMKVLVEGMRGMIYFSFYCLDRIAAASSDQERIAWNNYLDILTPVVKAYCSDTGNRVVETAMQVYGGYGYSREYPIEQYLRDIKISTIFEGTNGVQAMDLLGRKIAMNRGVALASFLELITELISGGKDDDWLGSEMVLLEKARESVLESASFLTVQMGKNVKLALLNASPFLDLFGDTVVGWQVLWQAGIAREKLVSLGFKGDFKNAQATAERNPEAAYYVGKIAAAKYYANNFLTKVPAKSGTILNGDQTALEIPENSFAALR
jgi:hypothetical protein